MPEVQTLLENGYDIRTVQELLGHNDVRTTMVCMHVLNRVGKGVLSPADRLQENRFTITSNQKSTIILA